MIAGLAPFNDKARIQRLMAATDALLLDFDGPVCSVFAGYPAPIVADQLRDVLAQGGHVELPTGIETTNDPFEVLYHAANLGQDEGTYVEATLRALEVEAIATAAPTPGAHELVHSWAESGRKIAIVSNNSRASVEAYVSLHGLPLRIFSARESPDPDLLKPNPYLVAQAIKLLGSTSPACTLVGDSLTDLQAGSSTQVRVIGFANKRHKVSPFRNSTAAVVVDDMRLLVAP